MKRFLRYFFIIPLLWIFYSFFRPTRLEKKFNRERDWKQHVNYICRLLLPIFLVSYPLALITHFLLRDPIFFSKPLSYFFLAVSWTTIFGIVAGLLLGLTVNVVVAIILSIGGGIVGDIPFGITGHLIQITAGRTGLWPIIGLGVIGFLIGVSKDARITETRVVLAALTKTGFSAGARSGIMIFITMYIGIFIINHTAFPMSYTLTNIIAENVIFGTLLGLIVSTRLVLKESLIYGITLSLLLFFIGLFTELSNQVGILGFIGTLLFLLCYISSYYRLLFYPIDVFFERKTYWESTKAPRKVFIYLRHSPLYWDEGLILPLFYLEKSLLIALKEDSEKTESLIEFIINKRPRQIWAAQSVGLEIAIRDLESCKDLSAIAKISKQLPRFLPSEKRRIASPQIQILSCFNDVSKDVTRHFKLRRERDSREALQEAVKTLEELSHSNYQGDIDFSRRIGNLTFTWSTVIQSKLGVLEKQALEIGEIDDPYDPGMALEVNDSRYVGREDIMQILEKGLSKKTGRPRIFFLNGERRMGKTSTLKQLPGILGSHYISIFYDLQSPGRYANTSSFMSAIAEEIHKAMGDAGISVKKLSRQYLREIEETENTMAVYREFDTWFATVEKILRRKNRLLLLTFDEFEMLMEEEAKGFDLNTLLNWFPVLIRDQQNVVLLFSGLRTWSTLHGRWQQLANVRTLHVSFLEHEEAKRLITSPIEGFPGESIFGQDVVEEIMRVTGCHPFLIQTLCSALISYLNQEKRDHAVVQDIAWAINQVFRTWQDYFYDLWTRTDETQRRCLLSLVNLKTATVKQIKQTCYIDETVAYDSMQILQQRDLVQIENGKYHIVAPIFTEWVVRNSSR